METPETDRNRPTFSTRNRNRPSHFRFRYHLRVCFQLLLAVGYTCVRIYQPSHRSSRRYGRRPHDIIIPSHRITRKVYHLAGFAEKPTEKCSAWLPFGFGFTLWTDRNQPAFSTETRNADRAIPIFASQHCSPPYHIRTKVLLLDTTPPHDTALGDTKSQ